jgi:hypothetical protein
MHILNEISRTKTNGEQSATTRQLSYQGVVQGLVIDCTD